MTRREAIEAIVLAPFLPAVIDVARSGSRYDGGYALLRKVLEKAGAVLGPEWDAVPDLTQATGIVCNFADYQDGRVFIIACLACNPKGDQESWYVTAQIGPDALVYPAAIRLYVMMAAREACVVSTKHGCQHWNDLVNSIPLERFAETGHTSTGEAGAEDATAR